MYAARCTAAVITHRTTTVVQSINLSCSDVSGRARATPNSGGGDRKRFGTRIGPNCTVRITTVSGRADTARRCDGSTRPTHQPKYRRNYNPTYVQFACALRPLRVRN